MPVAESRADAMLSCGGAGQNSLRVGSGRRMPNGVLQKSYRKLASSDALKK